MQRITWRAETRRNQKCRTRKSRSKIRSKTKEEKPVEQSKEEPKYEPKEETKESGPASNPGKDKKEETGLTREKEDKQDLYHY